MQAIIKHFRKALRMTKPAKPTATPFTSEWFLQLLLLQQEGLSTRAQDKYISREINRNPEAADLYATVRAQDPPKRLTISSCYRAWLRVAAVVVVASFLTAGIYALHRYYKISITPREQETSHKLQRLPLNKVAKIIERAYSRKVIFDREEIRDTPFNGKIETSAPIEDVLSDLRSAGVKYEIDENGDVHFK